MSSVRLFFIFWLAFASDIFAMPAQPDSPLQSAVILRKGTLVKLQLIEAGSSRNHHSQDLLECRVFSDVTVDGHVVIRTNVHADISISKVRRAGAFGRPGLIVMGQGSVKTIDGQDIFLDIQNHIYQGESRRALAWTCSLILAGACLVLSSINPAMALLTIPAFSVGFLIKGKDVQLGALYRVDAKVRQDTYIKL